MNQPAPKMHLFHVALRRTLTEPSAEVTDRSDRRTARLLSTVLLSIAPLGLASVILQMIDSATLDATHVAVFVAVVAIGMAYALSRTRHFRIAGAITTLIPTIGGIAVFAADQTDPGWFAFMALNPALGTLLVNLRWSIPLAVVNLLAVCVAVITASDLDGDTAIVAIMFNVIVSAVVLTAARHRNRLEEDRRADLVAKQRLQDNILQGTLGGLGVIEGGVITDANPMFADLFLSDQTRLTGSRLTDLFDSESFGALDAIMGQADGEPVEIYAIRRDGSTFDAEVLVRSTNDVDGAAQVLAIRDISDRKISDRALLRAQRMESVGRLAAGIAHDTNNELLVITAHADLLKHEQIRAGMTTNGIEQIQGAADRVATMIRRVLVFGRGQATELSEVDLDKFINRQDPMWQQVLGSSIELETSTPGVCPHVMIDSGHLEQVLLNLVLNARDAISGSGVVRIETGSVEHAGMDSDLKPGKYGQITVTDSGTGIASDLLPHVFDAFFTTKDEGLGTGLGLYTSREIVRSSGGELVADNDATGTTFTVLLPGYEPN